MQLFFFFDSWTFYFMWNVVQWSVQYKRTGYSTSGRHKLEGPGYLGQLLEPYYSKYCRPSYETKNRRSWWSKNGDWLPGTSELCARVCVCMYVDMYVCMYVDMYVCTYVCVYVCIYECMYVCTYVCVYVCVLRTYVCACVCMHECMYVCTYVRSLCMCIHIYTHYIGHKK